MPGEQTVDAITQGVARMPSATEQAIPSRPGRGDRRVTVLCTGGVGRSGSTLLVRMLGQLPGHVTIGELVYVWELGLLRDHRCGCGAQFSQCPFWSEVGRLAFGGWDALDLDEMLALKRAVDGTRRIPLLVAPWIVPGFRRRLVRYAEILASIYAAIAEVSGAEVIVDSSKHPSTLYVLRRTPGIHLRALQLIRDPRGVAYSWSKEMERPERPGVAFPRWPARTVSRRWITGNLLVAALARLGVPVLRMRYEDLVQDPAGELDRVFRDTQGSPLPGAPAFLRGEEIELAPTHTLAGNPMRFRTGRMQLRADEAWRTSLPASKRRLVGALTWILRRRYGYAGRAWTTRRAPS
jgi:Sulfotransferase domain